MRCILVCSALLSLPQVEALQFSNSLPRVGLLPASTAGSVSRRRLGQECAVVAFGLLSSRCIGAALADEAFNGAGLERYIDTQKGFKLFKPIGWNQFDADPGVYDVKFQDLIETNEVVQVSSSPVSTATSISALGDVATVGAKIAASRSGAKLVSSSEREADGSLVYQLELQGDAFHEYVALSINRGKLYRLTATANNKRWPKRVELYKNVMLSFVPKGF